MILLTKQAILTFFLALRSKLKSCTDQILFMPVMQFFLNVLVFIVCLTHLCVSAFMFAFKYSNKRVVTTFYEQLLKAPKGYVISICEIWTHDLKDTFCWWHLASSASCQQGSQTSNPVTNKYCGQYLSTFVKGTANIAICGEIYFVTIWWHFSCSLWPFFLIMISIKYYKRSVFLQDRSKDHLRLTNFFVIGCKKYDKIFVTILFAL
jgi:hypothetical protein